MPEYECEECGTTNEIPMAVIRACSEHVRACNECGDRQAFNFAGAP